jgi:hypothetical protein
VTVGGWTARSVVYLVTDIPELYNRLGAEVHEDVQDDFWILRIDSDAAE